MRRTSRDRSGVRGGADRVRRDWGRVVSVRKRTAGRPVTAAAAIGALSVAVRNGVLFGDRGSVKLGDQVTKHTGWDETTGLLTIVDPLVAALEVGDRVFVYDRGRGTVVTDLEVLVDRDDDAGAPLPVYADAGMVTVLPPGPREAGEGEVVQIEYDPDDEVWSIIRAPGLAEAAGMKAKAHDAYTLTTTDTGRGYATIPLSHVPVDESVKLTFGGVPQEPTEYTVDYDAATITFPLDGWEPAGLRVWVHYWYVKGNAFRVSGVIVPFESAGWSHLQVAKSDTTDRSATGFDDSGWSVAPAAFGGGPYTGEYPAPATAWPTETALWLRRTVTARAGSPVVVSARSEVGTLYWNGVQVGTFGDPLTDVPGQEFSVAIEGGDVNASNTFAVRFSDDSAPAQCYADAKVEYA